MAVIDHASHVGQEIGDELAGPTTSQPTAAGTQPRRPPALTPARRAALRHEVVVARHRWPAACEALQDAREVYEAGVAADGRSIRVRCTADVAAMLQRHATESQP